MFDKLKFKIKKIVVPIIVKIKWLIAHLVWCIKQLLPLTYRSHYTEDGKKYFEVWRMWFGRSFDRERVEKK